MIYDGRPLQCKENNVDDCVLVLFSIKGVRGLNMQVIDGWIINIKDGCPHQCEGPSGGWHLVTFNMQVLDGCPIQRQGCESLQYESLSGGCHLQYSGWLSYSINNNTTVFNMKVLCFYPLQYEGPVMSVLLNMKGSYMSVLFNNEGPIWRLSSICRFSFLAFSLWRSLNLTSSIWRSYKQHRTPSSIMRSYMFVLFNNESPIYLSSSIMKVLYVCPLQ